MSKKLEEVFGVSRKRVSSYLKRPAVDEKFIDALRTDKQIIVYGASKQGKTALVSRYLPHEDNIVISLSPRSGIQDIYKYILSEAGVVLATSFSEGTGVEGKIKSKAKIETTIAMLGKAGTEIQGEIGSNRSTTTNYEEIEFNLNLPNDVASLLRKVNSKKYIILENFHYLDDDIQQKLAFDLRTFQDLNVKFVILGVWKEANRLTQFNGELQDRVIEIPVEPWDPSDFKKIASLGGKDLNIQIGLSVLDNAIKSSFSSVGVFQELMKLTCKEAGVHVAHVGNTRILHDMDHLKKAIEEKTKEYSGRHLRNLESIASGNPPQLSKGDPMPFFLSYYIVDAILELGYDKVVNGVSKEALMGCILPNHHRREDLKGSHLTGALKKLSDLQNRKSIHPPVLAYDSVTRQLKIIDSTFYFFLQNYDLSEAREEIISPLENLVV